MDEAGLVECMNPLEDLPESSQADWCGHFMKEFIEGGA